MKKFQKMVSKEFEKAFGRTPLKQRLDDVMGEVIELCRFSDMKNLKEEAGDSLCSLLKLIDESGWNSEDLVKNTLKKIKRRQKQYKSLGRKIKVAIIGGAFDPPHAGHIANAKFVLDASKTFDEVLLMPCARHMYGKKMTPFNHRYNMCQLAAASDARIKVSSYEYDNNLSGETYYLLKKLLEEDFAKDKYDFSFVIGLDNALSFEKWVNYEHLEKMMRFVVVARKGYALDPKVTWFMKHPHIYLHQEQDIPEVSSTQLRKSIKEKKKISPELMDPKVYEYIKKHKLYV